VRRSFTRFWSGTTSRHFLFPSPALIDALIRLTRSLTILRYGIALGSLPEAFDAIKTSDFLLRDVNFPLVIVDFVSEHAGGSCRKNSATTGIVATVAEAVPTHAVIIHRHG